MTQNKQKANARLFHGLPPFRGLAPTAVLCHHYVVLFGVLRYRGLRFAPPAAVLFHRSAVLCYFTANAVLFCRQLRALGTCKWLRISRPTGGSGILL